MPAIYHWPLVWGKTYIARTDIEKIPRGTKVIFLGCPYSHYDDTYFYRFKSETGADLGFESQTFKPEQLAQTFVPTTPPFAVPWTFPFNPLQMVSTQLKVLEKAKAIRVVGFKDRSPRIFYHDIWPSEDWKSGSYRPIDDVYVCLSEVARIDATVFTGLPVGSPTFLVTRNTPTDPWTPSSLNPFFP